MSFAIMLVVLFFFRDRTKIRSAGAPAPAAGEAPA
jgi:hypothetical protein